MLRQLQIRIPEQVHLENSFKSNPADLFNTLSYSISVDDTYSHDFCIDFNASRVS